MISRIIKEDYITEHYSAMIIRDILSALYYCHNAGLVHRDIKPENLLFEDDSPNARLKVIDFGISERLYRRVKSNVIIGSAYYIAPEVIEGEYDDRCDVWSVGVILHILLCGYPPFNGDDEISIVNSIVCDPVKLIPEDWIHVSN